MKINKNLVFVMELFLIIVLPILTVGFDYFENSSIYKHIFGFTDIEKVMIQEFLTPHLNSDRKLITTEDREFYFAWELIKTNTLKELPNKSPYYIVRLPVKNAAYSPYINNTQFILLPESTPIVVGYCNESDSLFKEYLQYSRVYLPKCSWDDTIVVGTIGDFKGWISKKEEKIRIRTNLILSITSIILGVYIHFTTSKTKKNK